MASRRPPAGIRRATVGRLALLMLGGGGACIGCACLVYEHATLSAEFPGTTQIVARVVWLCSSDTDMERCDLVETFG